MLRSACALSAAALVLPLVACDASSSGSSAVAGAATSSVATGTVTGSIDRSGVSATSKADTTSATTAGFVTSTVLAVPAPVSTPVNPLVTPNPVAVVRKSISAWVSCGTATDDTSGAQVAFAAAKHNAFTLVVDCPVHLHSAMAIDRGIFIDSGTTVEFTSAGKFFVDNLFHPAFVIANSSNITLTHWNVEWDGNVPINPDVGGYTYKDKFVSGAGVTQPAGAFNDLVLTPWMASNRGVNFDETRGWVKSIWVGGVDPMAVFYLTGDSSNVVFTGLKVYVPATSGGEHFLPMAVAFAVNWKSNQTVTGKTPHAAAYAAVPHGITFSGVDLDGTLMGYQGNVQNALFENVTSHRYGDLQDASGGNTGGLNKWFPPPHLFYLNYSLTGDPALFNTNIHISNVADQGIRLGTARDKAGDGMSGYANSLKLGCTECTVDNYSSARPDGFMDVLPSSQLTISNVTASYDSTFLNNVYPAAVRFPSAGYSHITFENMKMTDTAASVIKAAMSNALDATNDNIVFINVLFTMSKWVGNDLPLPVIAGVTNDIAVNYAMTAQSQKVSYQEKSLLVSVLQATPISVQAGGTAVLTWSSKAANGCTASGAWNGGLSASGSKTVKIGAAGNSNFNLACQNSSSVATATTQVVGQ